MEYQYYKLKRTKGGKLVPWYLGEGSNSKEVVTYLAPATKPMSKIYIVLYSGKIIYVGTTKRTISSRMRDGFTAKGENGYYGYKWRKLKGVDMVVWFFPDKDNSYIEAVEAELVYLVRKKTKRWPEYQTEIHFNNSNATAKKKAKQVYNKIKSFK
jgi:hypothetical protein